VRIGDMSWMQVEAYLERDDRAVLPLGSTEQHGYLRLTTDCILPERVAAEAAEPLGIPVFPVLPYGVTPYFGAYPGTVSLRVATHLAVVRDVLDGLAAGGFRRLLVVNGHGGNGAVHQLVPEWTADHPDCRLVVHDWWRAPRTLEKVREIDPVASHASWMESFPWTRLPEAEPPEEPKPMADLARIRRLPPRALRDYLGDGNFGGRYRRSDEEMRAIWEVAVDETRALLRDGWGGGEA